MKKIIVLSVFLSLFLSTEAYAVKVVKQISTGAIIYRSDPDFEPGKGKLNASRITSIAEADLQEVNISQTEWDNYGKAQALEDKKNLSVAPSTKAIIKAVLVALKKKNPTLVLPTEDEIKAEIQ